MSKEEYIQSLENFYLHSDFNDTKAIQSINKMYGQSKFKPPAFVIILNSPYYLDYAFKFVKEMLRQIDGQVCWKKFKDENWVHLKEKIKKFPGFRVTNNEIWNNTCDMVYSQVKQQIMNLNIIPLEFGEDINGAVYRDSKEAVVYVYDTLPEYLNVIKEEITDTLLHTTRVFANHYINVFYFPELREAGINSISCLENICFISKPPTFVRVNEAKQLDCKNDYALYWDGGIGKYYVRGVRFEEDLFVKAFKTKTLLREEILQVPNTEQKAVLIEEYGYEYIKSALSHFKLIDRHTTTSKITGRTVNYELFEYDFAPNIRLRVIQVECHSTHHKTFIGVPRIRETGNCLDAIGWTFGFEPGEYQLLCES